MMKLMMRARRAPARPGVYFFSDGRGRVLYIGKAANLRSRLASYFAEHADLPPAKRSLLREATRIAWRETENDIAALLLEARLIKQLRPKYNIVLRDDKNYFFVGFTKETLPRIFLTHQPRTKAIAAVSPTVSTGTKKRTARLRPVPGPHTAEYVGPFTDGRAIKRTLRLLRRVFPYATHKGFPKRCLEYDMGLCPIPPGSEEGVIMRNKELGKMYRANIRAIRDVLTGKRQTLLKRIEREMHLAAKRRDFATAAKRRDEMLGLKRIFQHRTVLTTEGEHRLSGTDVPPAIRRMLGNRSIRRIEGYDIANLAGGKAATGSMVVFQCEQTITNTKTNHHEFTCRPENAQYRQFRIKTVSGAHDVAMLKEVLQRRWARHDWPLADLVLIDGGKPQLYAAVRTVSAAAAAKGASFPPPPVRFPAAAHPLIISLAKRKEEMYLPGSTEPLRLSKDHPFLNLLMHVRDEAHRFARRYHHRLRDLDKSV